MKHKHGSLFSGNSRTDPIITRPFRLTQLGFNKKRIHIHNLMKIESSSKNLLRDRSIVISKYGSKKEITPINSKEAQLICTYYGKLTGKMPKFAQKAQNPTIPKHLNKNPSHLGAMLKTSSGWMHNDNAEQENVNKNNIVNLGATQTGFKFPPIETNVRRSWKDRFPIESKDPYIKSITSRKNSIPASTNDDVFERQHENEEKISKIRAFNWEGIHFEISPKKPEETVEKQGFCAEYSKEMNLMNYNFNNSITRNQSESPRGTNQEAHIAAEKKLTKKNSMNLILKEKYETETSRTSSTTTNTNDDRIEKTRPCYIKKLSEDDNDDSMKNIKRSPRAVFGQPNSIEVGGRIQSPPNPITNTSIFFNNPNIT